MEYLTARELFVLHADALEDTGGLPGVHTPEAVQAVLDQVRGGFGDTEFYPTVADKAAFQAYSLLRNHPFVDGNKRVAYQVMDVFLGLNGYGISATVDEQERAILGVASGELDRDAFFGWVKAHVIPRPE